MPRALILYTDGRQEVKVLNGYEAYQKVVCGNIESLPIARGYVNPEKKNAAGKRSKLVCYVNDEGMIKSLALNPYAGILSILGVQLSLGLYIFGNVIVFADSDDGDDKPVDPYIVKLFADAKGRDDEEDNDEFYLALKKLNDPIKKKAVSFKSDTKRKNSDAVDDVSISTKQPKLSIDPEMKNRLASLLKESTIVDK